VLAERRKDFHGSVVIKKKREKEKNLYNELTHKKGTSICTIRVGERSVSGGS